MDDTNNSNFDYFLKKEISDEKQMVFDLVDVKNKNWKYKIISKNKLCNIIFDLSAQKIRKIHYFYYI